MKVHKSNKSSASAKQAPVVEEKAPVVEEKAPIAVVEAPEQNGSKTAAARIAGKAYRSLSFGKQMATQTRKAHKKVGIIAKKLDGCAVTGDVTTIALLIGNVAVALADIEQKFSALPATVAPTKKAGGAAKSTDLEAGAVIQIRDIRQATYRGLLPDEEVTGTFVVEAVAAGRVKAKGPSGVVFLPRGHVVPVPAQ